MNFDNEKNNEENWKQRMYELEEKNMYYKLKRREKKELKALHKKMQIFHLNKRKEKKKKD